MLMTHTCQTRVGPVCLVEPQLRRAGTTLGAGETVILMTVNTIPLNNKGNTITLHHEHQVYLYLLRGFTIMGGITSGARISSPISASIRSLSTWGAVTD